MVRSIPGLGPAETMRPGYAIEYDFVRPTQMRPTLECRDVPGLWLAGQVNGTTGYEEAAALGLWAGINAACAAQECQPFVPDRSEGYLAVLVDDLVTRGTTEPYRMFTSRAEYRLLLRQDNADLRLSHLGHELGLLPERHYQTLKRKEFGINEELERLQRTRDGSLSLIQILRRPEISYRQLPSRNESLSEDIVCQVEIVVKYAGYINRQELEIGKLKGMEDKRIPAWIDYCR